METYISPIACKNLQEEEAWQNRSVTIMRFLESIRTQMKPQSKKHTELLPRIIIAEIIIYQLTRFHTIRKSQAASSPFIIISIFVERSSTSQVIRHPVKIADSHPVILIAIHILNNARCRWSNRWRIIVIATRRQTSNSQAQKQNHGHFSNLFIYHIFHL